MFGRILLFVLLGSAMCLQGQDEDFLFAHLNKERGLSHNQVNCFLRDSKGMMWIGTMSGLNRFDGTSIKIFRHSVSDSSSVSDNAIEQLLEDHQGNIWVLTRSGVCVYDRKTERFSSNPPIIAQRNKYLITSISSFCIAPNGIIWFINQDRNLFSYNPSTQDLDRISIPVLEGLQMLQNEFVQIRVDRSNNLWVLQTDGFLFEYSPTRKKIVSYSAVVKNSSKLSFSVATLFIDHENNIWIANQTNPDGVYMINTRTNSSVHYSKKSVGYTLSSDFVYAIAEDSKQRIWIGTDHGGIDIIDKKLAKTVVLKNTPDNKRSLSQDVITSLYYDATGVMWAGTFKQGVNYYHPDIYRFRHFYHQASNPKSLPYDDVNCFAEDKQGNIWIGTNGKGLYYYNRKNNSYIHWEQESGTNSLSANIIVSLYYDKSGLLWIGYYWGGLSSFDGKKFTHYRQSATDPNSLSDDRVWDIFEDIHSNLWIGTLNGGLNLFRPNTQDFERCRYNPSLGVSANFILNIKQTKDSTLWFGTTDGLFAYNPNTKVRFNFSTSLGEKPRLSNNNVICTVVDSRGWLWVGTREGLNLYDPRKHTFRTFREEDGLPDNTITTILADNEGNLWLATPKGLCNVIIEELAPANEHKFNFRIKKYDESDGIQGLEFNEKAAFKTSKGELVFGGSNGFNLFLPSDLQSDKKQIALILTNFQLFGKEITPGQMVNGRVLLQTSILETSSIVLKDFENAFTLEFAAIDFLHPEKSRYEYMLEGFDKSWTVSTNNQKVSYTNLDPGSYVFRVRVGNNNGLFVGNELRLQIQVLPPFYKTTQAFVIYILLVLMALIGAAQILVQRERKRFLQHQHELEDVREKEHEALKLRFFTNVSHEFRTPISLIIIPLEKIMGLTTDAEQKKHLTTIYRNAKRLLYLANQLLDFRKLEFQELKHCPTEGEYISFIREIALSFTDLADKKRIALKFSSFTESIQAFFDHDKLEKILFNLLSNAFKFMQSGGSVKLIISSIVIDTVPHIVIEIQDTGIGIPAEKKQAIFERFTQLDTHKQFVNQGSGIGLSLVKAYVELMEGKINLESEENVGSTFTVILPIKYSAEMPIQEPVPDVDFPIFDEELSQEYDSLSEMNDENDNSKLKKRPVLLLVDDNDDFRFYLKDNFKAHYKIIEADNGERAWEMVCEHLPDLIVSDIMMPLLDGNTLCHRVKNDSRCSHIPVILLTAQSADKQKQQGLAAGADDYITKPFNFELLEARIKNLIVQRKKLQSRFSGQIDIAPSEIEIMPLDQKMLHKAIEIVEKNMANTEFSVEELSRELGMSRVHFYKKVLALTGKSPIKFIRTIRMKRAANLLMKSQMNVAEIAYEVGFNNPKYFARYFREEFGVLPSQYNAQTNQKE